MRSKTIGRLAGAALAAGIATGTVMAGNLQQVIFYDKQPSTQNGSIRDFINNASIWPHSPGDPFITFLPHFEALLPLSERDGPVQASGNFSGHSAVWIRGWVEPPVDGEYTFYVTGAQTTLLRMSVDNGVGMPGNWTARSIVAETTASRPFDSWAEEPAQKTAPIELQRGQQYFVELLMKAGAGNNSGQVRLGWFRPDYVLERPMPMRYTQRFAHNAANCDFPPSAGSGKCDTGSNNGAGWDQQATISVANIDRPASANINVREGEEILVAPSLSFNPPVSFQWYDAETDEPIAGENLSHFAIERATLDDDQSVYLRITKGANSIDTGDVNINVNPDNTPPTIEFANAAGNDNGFTIQYSERVDPVTATDINNYQVVHSGPNNFTPAGTIDRIEMLFGNDEASAVVVFLDEDGYTTDGAVDVVVSNVQDTASNPLSIANNTREVINKAEGVITFRAYGAYDGGDAIGGTAVSDVLNNASLSNRYPENPDFQELRDSMEIPLNVANDYFGELIGYFTPTESGEYNFLMSADDQAVLFLGDPASEDPRDPANKIAIAGEPVWNGDRNYATNDRRGTDNFNGANEFFRNLFPDRRQAARINESKNALPLGTLNLTAGQDYYIQAVVKEGGGGDNLSVFMQTPGTWNTAAGSAPPAGLTPIPGQFLSPWTGGAIPGPIEITSQPGDITVNEGEPITLSVQHIGSTEHLYQWFRVTQQGDIIMPDQNEPTLNIGVAPNDFTGSQFKVRIRNAFSEAVSEVSTVTVLPDTAPPTVVRVDGNIDFNQVIVTFNEPVNEADLVNGANYSITKQGGGPLAITDTPIPAGLTDGGYTQVIIPTAVQDRPDPSNPGAPNSIYEVAVGGDEIKDVSEAENVMVPATSTFQAWVITRGFVNFQSWDGPTGTSLDAFHSMPGWPNNPSRSQLLSAWEINPGRDNFGARIRGFFYPQYDGRHDFYISADDQAALYISADANPVPPTDTDRYALEPTWNNYRDWTVTARRPNNENRTDLNAFPKTRISNMQAGVPQWMEIRWKEQGGGDSGAINVKTPEGPLSSVPANGSATRLTGGMIGFYASPNGASFEYSEQPQSVTVEEGAPATFSGAGTGEIYNNINPPTAFQWQLMLDGETEWADIPGASGQELTINPDLNDLVYYDGAQVRLQAMVPGATGNSDPATITVNVLDPRDVFITSVRGSENPNQVIVRFQYAVNDSSQIADNYTLTRDSNSQEVAISSAVRRGDFQTVDLTTTTALVGGETYTLTVDGITDSTSNANLVDDEGGKQFSAWQSYEGRFVREWYRNIGGGAVSDLMNNAKYPNNPDEVDYITSLEWNDGGFNYPPGGNRDTYGARARGLISVDATGDYHFAISCDDQAFLYLSTDATPGNKQRIAVEPNWQGFRQFAYDGRSNGSTARVDERGTYFPNTTGTTPINQSANTVGAITLNEGQQYYIEVLMKEGGGGDNLSVAWQLSSEGSIASGTPGISGSAATYVANPDNAINISAQPASSTVVEGNDAVFSVTANPTFAGPILYQWQRQAPGGSEFTDIGGATGASYTDAAVEAGDSGAQYRVVMSAPAGATATSAAATLTVGDDPGELPTLSISKSGNNVTVSYPNTAAAFSLDATTAIGTAFAPDSDQGTDDGTNINRVKDTTTDSATFWRLSNE